MFAATELLAFLSAVLVLVLVPGPNTMVLLAQSLGGGRRAGLATVAGIETGTLAHTLAAALGLSVLLSTSPLAFQLVKFAGVVYLIVIGLRTLLQPLPQLSQVAGISTAEAFRRGLMGNLLNPKAALFFLGFIPQFIHLERGRVFLQFVILGCIVVFVGACFGSLLSITASGIASWLRQHSSFVRWQQRLTGSMLILIAGWIALAWPSS